MGKKVYSFREIFNVESNWKVGGTAWLATASDERVESNKTAGTFVCFISNGIKISHSQSFEIFEIILYSTGLRGYLL